MKIITFLSDFGLKDGYIAQMKGVISNLTDANLIDISNEIQPHNIIQGAFVLRNSIQYFPKGTVHIAVIDPGVGTKRKGIIVVTKENILIGPDNGLLIPSARLYKDFKVYKIINKKYMNQPVSNTFHGRDIFSPVAAHIINGVAFDEIGRIINNYVDLDLNDASKKNNIIYGKIINVDRFGNIITNISFDLIREDVDFGKKINISVGKNEIEFFFVKSYGFVNKNEFLCTIGSSGLFEISINQGNAAKNLSTQPGDIIKILLN